MEKRKLEEVDEFIGPPIPIPEAKKKKKVLQFEKTYLCCLPSSESYIKSYMHRDVLTHVKTTCTNFVITASVDGHVKFWKKQEEGIEFVKHFRAHLGMIESTCVSDDGTLYACVGSDQAMKVFDVVNFDMINMMKLGYEPGVCEWVFKKGDPISAIAVSNKTTHDINIYDGRGEETTLKILKLHSQKITSITFNANYDVAISADSSGMLEYWSGQRTEFDFPANLKFEYKTDTELFDFVAAKTHVICLAFSPDGSQFVTTSTDRKVRVFRFLTGKKTRVFDESLKIFTEMQQEKQVLANMEFGRRMAMERELEKSDSFKYVNPVFDQSGYFILYATLLGIKVINIHSNRCVTILGKNDNVRFLNIALYQGSASKSTALSMEMLVSENPGLEQAVAEPTLICTGYKKNRFYLFNRSQPDETHGDRDIFNEKPSREEVVAAIQEKEANVLSESVCMHTTLGDIHIKLFPKECPKTIENFVTHCRSGYYNNHIFHRIIKKFMNQTGDPLGDGSGGESIWGKEFEDEFHPSLRHNLPYTLSMANAGQNTNGSQFFITVVPTPWLDNKHTVFGRVTRGMDVCELINEVKTYPKNDKPYEDVKIMNMTVK